MKRPDRAAPQDMKLRFDEGEFAAALIETHRLGVVAGDRLICAVTFRCYLIGFDTLPGQLPGIRVGLRLRKLQISIAFRLSVFWLACIASRKAGYTGQAQLR